MSEIHLARIADYMKDMQNMLKDIPGLLQSAGEDSRGLAGTLLGGANQSQFPGVANQARPAQLSSAA
jgi:hypothetical protein